MQSFIDCKKYCDLLLSVRNNVRNWTPFHWTVKISFEQCRSLIRKTVNDFVFSSSFVVVFVFSISFVFVFVFSVSLYLYFCFIVHTVWFSPEALPQSGQKDCQCLWARFDPYWQNAEDGNEKRPKELSSFHVFVFLFDWSCHRQLVMETQAITAPYYLESLLLFKKSTCIH